MTQYCFHCHEPVLCGDKFQTKINDQQEIMCCPGCQAVAQAIIDAGLISYYQYRSEPAQQQSLIPDELKAYSAYDLAQIQADFVHCEDDISSVSLTIDGMTCAACSWLIEHKLQRLNGINKVSVNSTTQRALIHYHAASIKLSEILLAIAQIGYQAAPYQVDEQEIISKRNSRQFLIRLGLAAFASMQVMMFALALYAGYFQGLEQEYRDYFRWVSLIFAAPVVFYSAAPFYFSAIRSLLMGRVNMDLGVSIAICGAYIASCIATIRGTGEVYFESASMFTFFLLLGRYLEQNALQKAAVNASNLHKLIPLTARKYLATQSNKDCFEEVPAKQLVLEDIIQVRPGETIAADGEIIKGQSSINEAMLTGEQDPNVKHIGAPVYAGTINIDQPILVRVSALGQAQLLSKIIRLQENAAHIKPKIAETAARLSSIFSSIILAIAAITYLVWYQRSPDDAFWITLSVLVATCPCALALATPTAITCATSRLTKLGIIIRQAEALEALPKIQHVVFDKTGTLTCGHLSVSHFACAKAEDKSELLNLIANLELGSLHPIAKACESYLSTHLNLTDINHQTGQGISATWAENHYRFGHYQFACSNQPMPDWANEINQQGLQIWLSKNNAPIACLQLTDKIRPDAASTVAQLKSMGIAISIASGDHSQQVSILAKELGIDNLHSAMSPADKLKLIETLQQTQAVAMFGDGINDAPVLAAAGLSVAMGSGTALAKSKADMILLGDHLERFTAALKIAKTTRKIIYQNLYWALGYNLLILPLAASGYVYPYIAALGMSISSLIVVINSLRLLRIRP